MRSPHLVPYCKVDEAIKKANRYVIVQKYRTISIVNVFKPFLSFLRLLFYFISKKEKEGILYLSILLQDNIQFLRRDTASETVRTLLVYGYSLDPPTGEAREGMSLINMRYRCILLTKKID